MRSLERWAGRSQDGSKGLGEEWELHLNWSLHLFIPDNQQTADQRLVLDLIVLIHFQFI